jgi:hypothetical protein
MRSGRFRSSLGDGRERFSRGWGAHSTVFEPWPSHGLIGVGDSTPPRDRNPNALSARSRPRGFRDLSSHPIPPEVAAWTGAASRKQ